MIRYMHSILLATFTSNIHVKTIYDTFIHKKNAQSPPTNRMLVVVHDLETSPRHCSSAGTSHKVTSCNTSKAFRVPRTAMTVVPAKAKGFFRAEMARCFHETEQTHPKKFISHNNFYRNMAKWIKMILTGWWIQPIWKICSSKWVHLPQVSGWKFQQIFELPPPSHIIFHHLKPFGLPWN